MLARLSAHRIRNGVEKLHRPRDGGVRSRHAENQHRDDSGMTSTASNNPPRRSVTASAAPISPVNVSAGRADGERERDRQSRARFEIEHQRHDRHSDNRMECQPRSSARTLSSCRRVRAACGSSPSRSSEPSSRSEANKRSSVSSEASSAPIHESPGRCASEDWCRGRTQTASARRQ